MSHSESRRQVCPLRNRKSAACCYDAVVTDDHSSVVKGRILEKNIHNQPTAYLGVNDIPCVNDRLEKIFVPYYDKRSSFLFGHFLTGLGDGSNRLGIYRLDFGLDQKPSEHWPLFERVPCVSADVVEETPDFRLKYHYNGHSAHIDEGAEDGR